MFALKASFDPYCTNTWTTLSKKWHVCILMCYVVNMCFCFSYSFDHLFEYNFQQHFVACKEIENFIEYIRKKKEKKIIRNRVCAYCVTILLSF